MSWSRVERVMLRHSHPVKLVVDLVGASGSAALMYAKRP